MLLIEGQQQLKVQLTADAAILTNIGGSLTLHSDYISLNSELDPQSLQDRASVLVYSPHSSCGLLEKA